MIEPARFSFADDGAVPNSRLPLLVYRRAGACGPGGDRAPVRGALLTDRRNAHIVR